MTGKSNALTPQEAKEWYIGSRRREVSKAALKAYKYRLSAFIRWCDEAGIENVGDLSGRYFNQCKIWWHEEGDLNNVTLNTQLSTIHVFIKG